MLSSVYTQEHYETTGRHGYTVTVTATLCTTTYTYKSHC